MIPINWQPVTAFWAMPDAIPTHCWHVVAVRNGKADWNNIVATYSDYDSAYDDAAKRTKMLSFVSFATGPDTKLPSQRLARAKAYRAKKK
jgi:hypothetical protein